MSELFKKLNLKDQASVVVLNAPRSIAGELTALNGKQVWHELPQAGAIEFLLAFATRRAEVDALAAQLRGRLAADEVIWVAYPKGSSKSYKADFNRDDGWSHLGAIGLEPVRQVAIDEDWSALRFRRVDRIARLTRDPERTLSEEGREKARLGRPTPD